MSLALCSAVMLEEITHHLKNGTSLQEVIICVLDNRELGPFGERFKALG